MTDEKIFEAMADIDEKYISDAHDNKNNKAKISWIKWTAVAACLCVAAGIILLVKYLDKPAVAYAETFNSGDLITYDRSSHVTMGQSLMDLSDNQLVRVAISLHEYYDAYPEYGFSWDNETATWDGFLAFEAYVRENEMSYVKEIGGTDFAETERNLIVCTIKKGDLEKLTDGKCFYTVVLFTANDTDIKVRSIESLDGKYNGLGCVAIPIISSFGCPSGYGRNATITISNSLVCVDFPSPEGFPDESGFYRKHEENLEAVKVENSELSTFLDTLYSFEGNPELDELRYSIRETYDLTRPDGTVFCHLYVTPTSIYLDFGLRGLFKFQ